MDSDLFFAYNFTSRLLYLNKHTRLVVWIGGKGLGLLGGDGGVPFDKDSHYSSSGLNSQGQGGYIQQEQVLYILRLITSQDGSLHSCEEFPVGEIHEMMTSQF